MEDMPIDIHYNKLSGENSYVIFAKLCISRNFLCYGFIYVLIHISAVNDLRLWFWRLILINIEIILLLIWCILGILYTTKKLQYCILIPETTHAVLRSLCNQAELAADKSSCTPKSEQKLTEYLNAWRGHPLFFPLFLPIRKLRVNRKPIRLIFFSIKWINRVNLINNTINWQPYPYYVLKYMYLLLNCLVG